LRQLDVFTSDVELAFGEHLGREKKTRKCTVLPGEEEQTEIKKTQVLPTKEEQSFTSKFLSIPKSKGIQ